MRLWKNVELDRVAADSFRVFLRSKGIRYETSEAGSLIHFEVEVNPWAEAIANQFLETL